MTNMGGYADEIASNYEKNITYIEATHKVSKENQTKLFRILRYINEDLKIPFLNKVFKRKKEIYFRKLIKDVEFEYFLDIGGKASIDFLEMLKEKKCHKKVLFLWDDVKYNKQILEKTKFYDEVFSYSKQDSKRYTFSYRPSFFLDIFIQKNFRKEIDLFYIGSWRDRKRAELLLDIIKNLKVNNMNLSLVKKHKKNIFREILNNKFSEILKEAPLSIKEVAENYKKTKVILDIQYKNQSGLSLRNIESIATSSKIITTNRNIEEWEMYQYGNVYMLNDKNPNWEEVNAFLKKDYQDYPVELMEKYSFPYFLKEVFGKGIIE